MFTAATDDTVGEDLTSGTDGVPYNGFWESLYLSGSNTALENVQVRYAGDTDGNGAFGGQVGSIETSFGSDDNDQRTRLTNVTIMNGYSNGLNVRSGNPFVDNMIVNDSIGIPAYFDIDSNPSVTNISGSGNVGGDRIAIQSGSLTEDRTWDYGELPLEITSGNFVVTQDADSNPVTLSVAPGTVIKMSQGGYLQAREGNIHAVGTPAEPIVITAENDDSIGGDSNGDADATAAYPGYWESIYLDGPGSVFENIEVRYAGDTDGNGAFGGQTGSFEIRYDSRDPSLQNRLTNVRISSGYSNGVNVRTGAPILDTVHVEDSLGYPFYFDIDSDPSTNELTGRDNAAGDRITLQHGTLTEDRTWDYGDLPLHIAGGDFRVRTDAGGDPATLTIAAGTVIKIAQGNYLWSDTGTIEALGTPSEPIVITAAVDDTVAGDSNGDADATVPYPGYWESVYLYGPNNVLENVEIRYAGDTDGNGAFGGQVGSVQIDHDGDVADEQPRLTNVRISEGYSNAVNVLDGDPLLQNVHAEGNIGYPFYFELDTNPSTSGLSGRENIGGDRIVIQSGTLTENRTWDYGDLPIHLTSGDLNVRTDGDGNPVTLTITPGTVVKVPQAGWIFADTGNIHAIGTGRPIRPCHRLKGHRLG